MRVTPTEIPGVLVIEPKVFGDARGFFFESFNQKAFDEAVGEHIEFVQDNHSRSARYVLRGLHYQIEHAQGKLVRVTRGAAFDVAVDLRRSSPAFGKWFGLELSEENRKQLWLPAGIAHGFVALQDGTEFLYKTTDYYTPSAERCIAWNDPQIGIEWPAMETAPILSAKDQQGVPFAQAEVYS
ncbi:dTDP-4-dehydrorhamnose 3,5-epimerase [Cupriavidus gilardii J11]|uniref:dTDP-4-dehydrorhamnose 3,5-epimerase n=1 Tax=Cupriavidus gilardii J11 TaxID=936133 RepID=A0A562BNL8_9BURK|nr:dTDP-4-dehydrorhamnose 3,5-epimerase [Cupriavidus gilardii]TWG86433.1 dTDP-4-dehydrorhamnose 3,5-epimerase [Cupriavidus gilardii J11]